MSIEAEIGGGLNPPIFTRDSSIDETLPHRKFGEKIREVTCYSCLNKGHYANSCPYKSPNKSKYNNTYRPDSAANQSSDIPAIMCACGYATCIVRTSRTDRNPDRKYYVCSVHPGGCNYFKWCDEVTEAEINRSSQFQYPKCHCGAGICHILKQKAGPNAGRKYFVCQIPKGHGACPFFQWQDTRGKTPINCDEADCKSFRSPLPTLKNRASSDLIKDGDFSVKRLKRMELNSPDIDNPQHSPNSVAVTETFNRNKVLPIEIREHGEQLDTPPKHCNLLQDGSSENDSPVPDSTPGQLVMSHTKPWGSLNEKALKASLLTSQAKIHIRQKEFWRQISAAGATSFRDPTYQILGLDVQGWLGRLAFPPSKCLTIPVQKPFFCCVFPSFDLIFVPRNVVVTDIKCSTILPHCPTVAKSDISGRLSQLNPAQNAQLSSDVLLWEPLGLKSPPNMLQSNAITGSIMEAFGQAAARVQNDLLKLLESMDPLDHESMVREANSAFAALDRLSVDYGPFYEHVKEFIGCASALSRIEQFIHNDTTSSQELIDQYNSAKRRNDDLSNSHTEVLDAYAASVERLQWLCEEASRFKSMLIEIENRLSSCEAETIDLETHLVQVCEEKLESEQRLQAASQKADEARKLSDHREAERRTAKAALEKARLQLRQ